MTTTCMDCRHKISPYTCEWVDGLREALDAGNIETVATAVGAMRGHSFYVDQTSTEALQKLFSVIHDAASHDKVSDETKEDLCHSFREITLEAGRNGLKDGLYSLLPTGCYLRSNIGRAPAWTMEVNRLALEIFFPGIEITETTDERTSKVTVTARLDSSKEAAQLMLEVMDGRAPAITDHDRLNQIGAQLVASNANDLIYALVKPLEFPVNQSDKLIKVFELVLSSPRATAEKSEWIREFLGFGPDAQRQFLRAAAVSEALDTESKFGRGLSPTQIAYVASASSYFDAVDGCALEIHELEEKQKERIDAVLEAQPNKLAAVKEIRCSRASELNDKDFAYLKERFPEAKLVMVCDGDDLSGLERYDGVIIASKDPKWKNAECEEEFKQLVSKLKALDLAVEWCGPLHKNARAHLD